MASSIVVEEKKERREPTIRYTRRDMISNRRIYINIVIFIVAESEKCFLMCTRRSFVVFFSFVFSFHFPFFFFIFKLK